jgi:hypothetical protein
LAGLSVDSQGDNGLHGISRRRVRVNGASIHIPSFLGELVQTWLALPRWDPAVQDAGALRRMESTYRHRVLLPVPG